MQKKASLPYLVSQLKNAADVTEEHLWYAIRNALQPDVLISNLAEALRISANQTEKLLVESGFGDIVAKGRMSEGKHALSPHDAKDYQITASEKAVYPFQHLFSIKFSPALHHTIKLHRSRHEAISLIKTAIIQSAADDPFVAMYRKDVMGYYDEFMLTDAKSIDRYISEQFGAGYPKYIVNSGIGANEQFNHFIARLNNNNPTRRLTWIIIDSPRLLANLPSDSNIENTLFMEFSRSGKTEETLKTHEYTPRKAKRIIFANSGPLKNIGVRDNNLILNLPDKVSGRFGRNKTPILLAPMHAAGMDTKRFWEIINQAVNAFDISAYDNLPMLIAEFIYLYQHQNNINHIYFGCNDDMLACSADELIQFWNEGVNKGGNDISMSRYFGLLRDSHLNIEGILANHKTKMGIFLLPDKIYLPHMPAMVSENIDPINPAHKGLKFGDEEIILAEANYQRFSELMPTIKITTHCCLTIDHAAVLGQLWADVTFCYSKMANVDPGSNPEVKAVRDRSASLLAQQNYIK